MSLKLPTEQKEYLKWYLDVFKKLDYSKPTPKSLEKEMYNRTIEGMKKFGWSKDFVYQTFFAIGDVEFSRLPADTQMHDDNGTGGGGSDDESCYCMYDLGCPGWNGDCNTDVECSSDSDTDCGFFGASDCTGVCW